MKCKPPTMTSWPSTRPAMPSPGVSTTSDGIASARPRPRASADDGLGDDVLGGLVERGGEPQQLVGRGRAGHPGLDQPGLAQSERAGLVDHQRAHAGERLDRLAALDQDAELGRARQAGHDGDRHRQNERTGRRHHQHRHRADGVARERPGGARQRHGDGEEEDGVAVGQPRHRRARALRRLHQPHDAGIGAFVGPPRGRQVEGLADIGRAAQCRLADPELHRQRLAGERRLVEHRHALGHGAVHRHHVALAHQQPVAGQNQVERHLLQPAVAVPHRRARHPRQQGRHFAARRPLGEALQVLAAGIHQGDDGRGELLADQPAPPSSTARRRCRGRGRRAANWSQSR